MSDKQYECQNPFGFDLALQALKDGKKVARSGWNGKGMHIELQRPDEHSKMTLPYIYLVTPNETPHSYTLVPWLASQTNMLAEDWELVE